MILGGGAASRGLMRISAGFLPFAPAPRRRLVNEIDGAGRAAAPRCGFAACAEGTGGRRAGTGAGDRIEPTPGSDPRLASLTGMVGRTGAGKGSASGRWLPDTVTRRRLPCGVEVVFSSSSSTSSFTCGDGLMRGLSCVVCLGVQETHGEACSSLCERLRPFKR